MVFGRKQLFQRGNDRCVVYQRIPPCAAMNISTKRQTLLWWRCREAYIIQIFSEPDSSSGAEATGHTERVCKLCSPYLWMMLLGTSALYATSLRLTSPMMRHEHRKNAHMIRRPQKLLCLRLRNREHDAEQCHVRHEIRPPLALPCSASGELQARMGGQDTSLRV